MRILFLVCCGGGVIGSAQNLAGGEPFPDFDLRVDCPRSVAGTPGKVAGFEGTVVLRSAPVDAQQVAGARAWSLSIRVKGEARIASATISNTDARSKLAPDGYEKTELTSGLENEGAVSAVILSFQSDVWLPPSGEATLLRLGLEAVVPPAESHRVEVVFVDGLKGSGQPVKNTITYGEGITRRDDGGELDNDPDGYDPCVVTILPAPTFVRGNTDGDDQVSLTDVIRTLVYLFQGGEQLECADAADVNDDGEVNLSDAAYLLIHLFRGGAPPPAPFPQCGSDTTPSVLSCERKECG